MKRRTFLARLSAALVLAPALPGLSTGALPIETTLAPLPPHNPFPVLASGVMLYERDFCVPADNWTETI